MSPVSTQPSRSRAAVCSGSFHRPVICPSHRIAISPSVPTGTARLSSPRISSSANGMIRPAARSGSEPGSVPNHSRGPMNVTGTASVWPYSWYRVSPNTWCPACAVRALIGAPDTVTTFKSAPGSASR
jgi:hypothetical protein